MDDAEGAPSVGEITRHLHAWKQGDAEAVNRLFPLIYGAMRSMARRQVRRAGRATTLDTTGLVHEAYLKLVDQTCADVHDREHFFAVAARAMRHILVDHARARTAAKRGGGAVLSSLENQAAAIDTRAAEIVAVDQALERLETLDPRLVRLVELRYFVGLSLEETAAAIGISERTARRDWLRARAFLSIALGGEGEHDPSDPQR